jgi:hypothetical protein
MIKTSTIMLALAAFAAFAAISLDGLNQAVLYIGSFVYLAAGAICRTIEDIQP